MSHQYQQENRKYRNWVKAGLGLKYTKDGLEPFCDKLVIQQHCDILNKVKQKHNLSTVICGNCDIKTLQPDHLRDKSRRCPLGQVSCNCQHPGGKIVCRNSVCSAIYDEIVKLHASTPPSPCWKNTDAKYWCTEPWAIAKCFLNIPGYETKLRAADFDCSGLLRLLINNIDFQGHLQCTINGGDPFSKVLQIRNAIFHSNNMELEDNDVADYIDIMIALLQDGKELQSTDESKDAVKKLHELKKEDFIITNTNAADIRRTAITAMNEKEKEIEQTIKRTTERLEESSRQTEDKSRHVRNKIASFGFGIEKKLKRTGENIEDDLNRKEWESKTELEKKATEIKNEIEQIKLEVASDVVKHKQELDKRGIDIKDELTLKESNSKIELEHTTSVLEDELQQREKRIRQNIHFDGKKVLHAIEMEGIKIKDELSQIETAKYELKQKSTDRNTKHKSKGSKMVKKQKPNLLCLRKPKGKVIKKREKSTGPLEAIKVRQQHTEYFKEKEEFKTKLVNGYKKYAVKLTTLPLQPDKNECDIGDVYVPPWITVTVDSKVGSREVMISMHHIFSNEEKPAKNIYILGEAGSGKSAFCKILVHYWCLAHAKHEPKTDKPDIVKEMQNYDFLFYISLRYFSELYKIETMLEEVYPDPILGTILQNESNKCLILLDGLDEWRPHNQRPSQFLTKGLPERDLHAEYTIITTSRKWKFDTLMIKDSEIDKKITLRGISGDAIEKLTTTTVNILNKVYHAKKTAEGVLPDLQSSPVADIVHIPMILQQLICLWYDGNFRGTSKCSVYSSMLELFFEWKMLKSSEKEIEVLSTEQREIGPRLPDYLSEYSACYDNTRVTYHLSRLAYQTLFDRNEENRLTFSNSTFQNLNIPDDVKMHSLNVGVLCEDQSINLFASRRHQSSFSFVHKSMQEFMAAVFIASEFETQIRALDKSQTSSDNLSDKCRQCLSYYFGDFRTVSDILEQSNVFVILCGLETQLLPYVSELIYKVTIADIQITEERQIRPKHSSQRTLKLGIQNCLVSCVKEVLSRTDPLKHCVNIADIILGFSGDVTSLLQKQILNLHSILSINIEPLFSRSVQDIEKLCTVLKCITECEGLKIFKYSGSAKINETASIEKIEEQVVEIIVSNMSKLETVNLMFAGVPLVRRLIQIMPNMCQLSALRITGVSVSHQTCRCLCTLLEQSFQLRQIWLDIKCSKCNKHEIDLTNHNELQYLDIQLGSISVNSFNTDILHTCKVRVSSILMMERVCDSLQRASKLEHLQLVGNLVFGHYPDDARIVTKNLITLLPLLSSLSIVKLLLLTFSDNIIIHPLDIQNLKEIELQYVTMSLTTWCKFVESLPKLPEIVYVKTRDLNIIDTSITRHGQNVEDNDYCYRRDEKNRLAARLYICENSDLFCEKNEHLYDLAFMTKKMPE